MEFIGEYEASKMLSGAGLNVAKSNLAKSESEAVMYSSKIGRPVVLKIVSKEIIHKTEAKGVRTNLHSEEDVRDAYNSIMRNALAFKKDIKIDGVLVEEQLSGYEFIIGSKRDPQFGPVIMFGSGGILVELFKDVSFRILPLTEKDARDMINETKGAVLLNGFRGKKPANVGAVVDTILKVSRFIAADKNIVELDINPLIVNDKSATVTDVKIIKQ